MRRLAAALILVALPIGAQAATLTITVTNIDPQGGTLRVSLYDEFTWSKSEDDPIASAPTPAVAPETVVAFKDVKPGVYGVKLFQDVNDNGEFDRNFIGLPLERYGFSRDAQPVFSEPGFDRAKITIHDGDNAITIHLQ